MKTKQNQGFTLIELTVVISIIGLFASVILVALNSARLKARDGRRVADMHQIVTALDIYYQNHAYYPDPSGLIHAPAFDPSADGCNGWNVSSGSNFLTPLITDRIMSRAPKDPLNSGACAFISPKNYFAWLLPKAMAVVGPPPVNPEGALYSYNYFSAGANGCDVNRGNYYVLGIKTMDTIPAGSVYPGSPGFSCIGNNWQSQFAWVTGKFEK